MEDIYPFYKTGPNYFLRTKNSIIYPMIYANTIYYNEYNHLLIKNRDREQIYIATELKSFDTFKSLKKVFDILYNN